MIYDDITGLIGKTPMINLTKLLQDNGQGINLYAKLESFNPAGSVKDRVAKYMIDSAENQGLLKPGSVIIEPTSGNTGIGLALIAAVRGYEIILTMPDTMSVERQSLLKAYGAKIVLTSGSLGMRGAIDKANEIASQTPGAFVPGQFENPANPLAHFETTGPEIWDDLDGKVDIFVACVGTGGTLSGAGKYLKSKNPEIEIVAVEPAGSPVLSGGKPGPHVIQGIGAGFIPQNFDAQICDKIITVTNDDALTTARTLTARYGIFAGISSGAATAALISLAKTPEHQGKTICTIFPDGGDKYLSTALFRQN